MQHAALVAVRQALGDLGGGGGLARALQADHQDADGRNRVEVDHLRIRAQHLHELVVDDLDHLLAGGDRLDHLGADRAGAHLVREGAHHLEGHVGLEQGAADLAQAPR